ncbi:MAG: L-seryl-tRNA(Sec) selenium transferase [Firmicutes bacterium]|nr:L-seryl-tRNA(Sec) selenium transferase [Bacillota bacterium]MDD3297862.1 L-seryl-tRNA(Sec) selenium transferase [Bacillota bacterium]MDD3850313.1 L-seryl-tRNA(Sec) selenium transferase [Bacillota bacterium]MDD4706985.1 L-seryl-tRNA(Sec) selenium transferase [Bacillota bacterium]
MNNKKLLRLLPSVDQMLRKPEVAGLIEQYARVTVTESLREILQETRDRVMDGGFDESATATGMEEGIVEALAERLRRKGLGRLKEVINGTGVVIHTNLGRSPVPESAVADLSRLAGRYINLEYNLQRGVRGSRHDLVRDLVCGTTGAEDCIVVNNNAAAVLLTLSAMASGKEAIVSRGELVEIGGSFRIPEVMEQGGARLVEVGTTNKTYIEDYQKAIGEDTAMLLKVHTSNYRICGFTDEVSRQELASLGRKRGIPVVEDLGSGILVHLEEYGIVGEPTVQDSIKSGIDIVTFSGDKLLGASQAGIIAGKSKYIKRIAKHPLARAVRVDRLTLAVLESTLRIYAQGERVLDRIPVLNMLTIPVSTLEQRAERLMELVTDIKAYAKVTIEKEYSQVGGGALPLERIETRVLTIEPKEMAVNELEKGLRMAKTPVIGRIVRDRYLIDVRTVFDEQLPVLAGMLIGVLSGGDGS